MIDLQTVVRKNEGIVSAQMDGSAVMMSVDSGQYYGFNEVASAIWAHLNGPVTVSELIGQLQNEYDVSAEQCEAEVLAFLSRLEREKLITVG